MMVELRNPRRRFEFDGPMAGMAVSARLGQNRESVLVIRDGTLLHGEAMLGGDAESEIRAVISGGGL